MKKILFIALLMVSASQLKAQDTLTIAQKINISYDSYYVIIMLDNKPQPLIQKDSMTRVRNVQHLNYMYNKPWFYNALTTEQRNQIQSVIQ